MQDFHGGFHEVCVGGTAHQRIDHVWGEVARGFLGAGRGRDGAVGIFLLRILDAPFEELVHCRVHDGGVCGVMEDGSEDVPGRRTECLLLLPN